MAPSDPVVLITGATGPLGRAAARAFGADGARLGIVGTDLGRLADLAADIGLAEDRWVPAEADLRDAAAATAAVRTVTDRFGRIDVLLHLVGGWAGGTDIAELDPATVTAMLDRHVWTTLHVVRAVVPGMSERGWGRVVAVTSTTTSAPGPRSAPYAMAKSAQEALVRVLAREVAGHGVTANLVAVATIDVEHEREAAPTARNARWTTPEEIVSTLRFLCSDDAAAINGARIALDGRG
jgi:NAD(P)-dependent dehydrogenase (short-subunit alcohol dehydrogenase family)